MSAGMLMLAVLLVAIGGAIGSLGRWAIAEYGRRLVVHHRSRVDAVRIAPWLTVLANMIACFLLGIIVAMTGSASGSGELAYLLLAAGLCGGLSTLSTAAMDIIELVRAGATAVAVGYLLLSIGVGMAMLWLGLVIGT